MSMANQHRVVDRAISKLKSLHDGDLGVVEVVACGTSAVPALRAALFQREPSGLFDTRCRAVEALAALGAHDILIEYLGVERLADDPIERLGDDAVINAAARALAKARDERVFLILLQLAQRPCLAGVIGALGAFGRTEAIPALIAALEDDAGRQPAELALKKMGRTARAALLKCAKQRLPSAEHESESSLRRRRSILGLLAAIGLSRRTWPDVRGLVRDTDAKIALLACKLSLLHAPPGERRDAINRLVSLLPSVDWMLREEIEDCLAAPCAAKRRWLRSGRKARAAFRPGSAGEYDGNAKDTHNELDRNYRCAAHSAGGSRQDAGDPRCAAGGVSTGRRAAAGAAPRRFDKA